VTVRAGDYLTGAIRVSARVAVSHRIGGEGCKSLPLNRSRRTSGNVRVVAEPKEEELFGLLESSKELFQLLI
jgi:hypothetical protein